MGGVSDVAWYEFMLAIKYVGRQDPDLDRAVLSVARQKMGRLYRVCLRNWLLHGVWSDEVMMIKAAWRGYRAAR